MIKLNLGEVVVADRTLKELDEQSLPFPLALAIDKVLRVTAASIAFFDRSMASLWAEYGVERDASPDEAQQFGPKVRAVPANKTAAFQERVLELEGLTIDLDVELIDFGPYAKDLNIKRRQLEKIRPLV